jgi:hypothetical protein
MEENGRKKKEIKIAKMRVAKLSVLGDIKTSHSKPTTRIRVIHE